MAKNFQTPINLNGFELLNARLQQLANAPSSPAVGLTYYDTTLGYARVYSASGWINITNAATYTDAQAQDAVGALINAGTQAGITVTYSSANKTLSFSVPSAAAAATPSLRTIGTGALEAAAGNDARLSDTRTPTDGSVTDAKVASNAAINADKIADGSTNKVYTATDKNKLSGIASGATANSTDAQLRDRSTHTGTQSADTIVDGSTNKAYTATEKTKLAGIATGATNYTDTNARANRLDQFAAPTATFSLNNQQVTGVPTPATSDAIANKGYVDASAQGLDFKASVALATTAALPSNTYANGSSGVGATLTAGSNGVLTIDGTAVAAGQRILVKNEATAANNGIYVVTNPGASGAAYVLTRATDADTGTKLNAGALTYVEGGSTYATQQWVLTTTGAITIGTTNLTFTQFSGASAATAGAGLAAAGNVFNVGQGTGIIVGADAISIDTTVVARVVNAVVGDGSATTYNIAHNLGKRGVGVQVWLNSGTYEEVEVDVLRTDANNVGIRFGTAPASNAYGVTIIG